MYLTWKLTHVPRHARIQCARCGCETRPRYGAGNAHVGYLFCGDMECYTMSLLLRYVCLMDKSAWCEQVATKLLALSLQDVCVRLLAYRERCEFVYGKVHEQEWLWIEQQTRMEGKEAA